MSISNKVKVIASSQPNPTWNPPPGELIVRMLIGPSIHEVSFEYLFPNEDHGGGDRIYRTIARIDNWLGMGTFGTYLECCQGDMNDDLSAAFVVRRLARMDDLIALRRLWSRHAAHPFPVWLKSALEDYDDTGLSAKSREMLLQLAPREPIG